MCPRAGEEQAGGAAGRAIASGHGEDWWVVKRPLGNNTPLGPIRTFTLCAD